MMPRYAIHAETRLVPNIRGELAPWVDKYHLVEVGAGVDKAGDQRSVCDRVVDPESSKPLRTWSVFKEAQRCPACENQAGFAVKKHVEAEQTNQGEWWTSHPENP